MKCLLIKKRKKIWRSKIILYCALKEKILMLSSKQLGTLTQQRRIVERLKVLDNSAKY